MRLTLAMGAATAALATAGAASAAPSVEIKNAVARVVIIPEARSDVQVTIVKSNAELPLRVTRFGDRVYVTGDIVSHRIRNCRSGPHPAVSVRGLGDISFDDMPQVVVHTPMDVNLAASQAVFGSVGRSESLDFANAGCGDWTIGNVKGRMRLSQAGSGDTHTGSAGRADLSIAGSGDIITRDIYDGLTAISSGSGSIEAASVRGDFNARIAGSGDVRSPSGVVKAMNVAIAGSGNVEFGGVARTLRASVVGSGDIHAAQVTGEVTRSLIGSGRVNIGPAPASERP